MTPAFRSKGSEYFKARIRHPDGRRKIVGCSTTNRKAADAMWRWAESLFHDNTPVSVRVLDAIFGRRVTLAKAFHRRNDLPGLLETVSDVNVEPMVETWHASKKAGRRGSASADKYLNQVRVFIPEGKPFYRSQFTRQGIVAFLRGLAVEDPTRNRYRAALASFGAFLRDEGVIERNPVDEIKGWGEGDPRTDFYTMDEAVRVVNRIAGLEERAAVALAIGAGVERQVLERIRAQDITLKGNTAEVWADGGKQQWRRRLTRIVPEFAWCIPPIRDVLKNAHPDALIFARVCRDDHRLLDAIGAAAKAAGLRRLTLHDQRHTHAVGMLRAGYTAQVVAHQLGESNANLVHKVYGRYAVDERDYGKQVKDVTSHAT